ncbi:invasion associated locus B family protein [Pseudorhodoplanes sp.]|uniref:invasion associated locus B family protein n=1 Tax=Pseudorhodoplanes sp. TaxID=1934341 RepID=UPI003D107C45
MTHFRSPSPLRSLIPAIVILAIAGVATAEAQQKPAQKAAPKGQQPAKPDAAKPAAAETPPLVYSYWTKLCSKSAETGGKTLCRTGRDGRLEGGAPMVGAVLMEAEGEPRKILQIMLPLGILLPRGTRVLVDNDEQGAMVLPIIVCAGGGCMAQGEASAELVAKLKKGQNLYVQAYNMQQSVFTLAVPLADFAKAYDGAPTDPKEVEQRNKKLQEELEKRAKERAQQGKPQ